MKAYIVLALCVSLLSSCVGMPEQRSRFKYQVDDKNGILVSTSPSFEKPVVERKNNQLVIQQSWMAQNASPSRVTFLLSKSQFVMKMKTLSPSCLANGQSLAEVEIQAGDKVLISCTVFVPLIESTVNNDEKASFIVPSDLNELVIKGEIFLRAEDYE